MEKLVGEIRNGAGRFATLAVKNLLDRSVSRSSGLLKRYRENGIGDGESRGAAEERRRRVVLIKRQRRKKKSGTSFRGNVFRLATRGYPFDRVTITPPYIRI